MKKEELDRILGKYYSGESSEEEEKSLRLYFRDNVVSEEYSAEETIFGYYSGKAIIEEPDAGFENRIISAIDTKIHRQDPGIFRRIMVPAMSVAASAAILIASYFIITTRSQTFDTYSDPELAYAETVKILMEVSQKLNRGTEALEQVSLINELTVRGVNAVYESTSVMEDNLKKIEYFKIGTENLVSSGKNDK